MITQKAVSMFIETAFLMSGKKLSHHCLNCDSYDLFDSMNRFYDSAVS